MLDFTFKNITFKNIIRSILLLSLIHSLILSTFAQAHNRSQSYSTWEVIDHKIEMIYTVKSREVTRLAYLPDQSAILDDMLIDHIQSTVSVSQLDKVCPSQGKPQILPANPGFRRVTWRFDCAGSHVEQQHNSKSLKASESTIDQQDFTIYINSFFELAPSHIHYAQWVPSTQLVTQYIFTDKERKHLITQRHSEELSVQIYHQFAQYVTLGVTHIFAGIDHIAFLLALLLLCNRFKDIVWLISGFSIGHSISLISASFGLLTPQVTVIEALIGFTIVLVSLEKITISQKASQQNSSSDINKFNHQLRISCALMLSALVVIKLIWQQGLPVVSLLGLIIVSLSYFAFSKEQQNSLVMRSLLTLAFGVIHGFGFANVLNEIGLPTGQLFGALLGFNIGVEIGQLIIVGIIYLVLKLLVKKNVISNNQGFSTVLAALLFGLGLYWFIVRSFSV